MTDSPVEALRRQLRFQLDSVRWSVRREEIGHISRVGDGVAYVRGMPSVQYGELLACRDGLSALAFDLRPQEVGVLFLGPTSQVAAGDEVRLTGKVASVPVGDGLLGRVVDPLGNPMDGAGPIRANETWPVEREAPGVVDRQPVTEALHTGTKVIDALLPIGRGQRELILGDRATGKTTIAMDAVLAQKNSGVLCVYVAIGARKAAVAEVLNTFATQGALKYTTMVLADADAAPGLQFLAPFAGCTIGEYHMHQGRSVLVVYDDLTRHADAYRRICLLLGRAPGREAYPADVFYLHARLLERATRLHDRLGGGSLTALPIAITEGGNLSAYIPTNLISITDGQIDLSLRLFNRGVRPAVDVGISVSRVGSKAQPPQLRRVVGDLKLLYSQLNELETFTRFGAELEPITRQRLERGRRLREVFKQGPHQPNGLARLLVELFVVREGILDPIPVEKVDAFITSLVRRLENSEAELFRKLEDSTEKWEPLQTHLHKVSQAHQQAFLQDQGVQP